MISFSCLRICRFKSYFPLKTSVPLPFSHSHSFSLPLSIKWSVNVKEVLISVIHVTYDKMITGNLICCNFSVQFLGISNLDSSEVQV